MATQHHTFIPTVLANANIFKLSSDKRMGSSDDDLSGIETPPAVK